MRRKIESATGNASGLTNVFAIANSPPGHARVRGADPERERLVACEAHARGDRGGLAVPHGAEGAAGPAAEDEPGPGERDERDRPAHVVEPVVVRERAPEDLDGVVPPVISGRPKRLMPELPPVNSSKRLTVDGMATATAKVASAR